jgi:hypothetical protein
MSVNLFVLITFFLREAPILPSCFLHSCVLTIFSDLLVQFPFSANAQCLLHTLRMTAWRDVAKDGSCAAKRQIGCPAD